MNTPDRTAFPKTPSRGGIALEDLAAGILGFLAEDPDRLSRFFDLTGLGPQTLRAAAARPGFAVSLIEYLAADDRLFLAFAADRGHDPAQLEAIRQRLAPRGNGDD